MQAYEKSAASTTLHPPKVSERFVDDVYSIFKRKHWKIYSITLTTFNKTLSLLESNGELAFLQTFLKRNKRKISALV